MVVSIDIPLMVVLLAIEIPLIDVTGVELVYVANTVVVAGATDTAAKALKMPVTENSPDPLTTAAGTVPPAVPV